MNTEEIYSGTPDPAQVEKFQALKTVFLVVDGTDFTATLQHLKASTNAAGENDMVDAVDADYVDLKSTVAATATVVFDENNNYQHSLAAGSYAIKFSAAGAAVTITVTG